MDQIPIFLHEMYKRSPTGRIQVKDIYKDFETWIDEKYDAREFGYCDKWRFYKELRSIGMFTYKKYYDGVCLSGIKYRGTHTPLEIDTPQLERTVQTAIEAGFVQRLRLNIIG